MDENIENMKIDMISLIFDSQGNHYLPGIARALQSCQLLSCNNGKGKLPVIIGILSHPLEDPPALSPWGRRPSAWLSDLFTGDFVPGCWWCGHFSRAPDVSVLMAGVIEFLIHKPDRPLGFQMLILLPFMEAFYGFLAA